MLLAADDEVTRQRCVRALEAAIAGGGCSSLHHIASAVALTPDLFRMQSLPAVNAVLAALGKAAAKGLDAKSLKDSRLDAKSLKNAGFDAKSLMDAGFDADVVIRSGKLFTREQL